MKRSRLQPDSAEHLLFLHHNAAKFEQIRIEEEDAERARIRNEPVRNHEEFIVPRADRQQVLNFCYLNISYIL